MLLKVAEKRQTAGLGLTNKYLAGSSNAFYQPARSLLETQRTTALSVAWRSVLLPAKCFTRTSAIAIVFDFVNPVLPLGGSSTGIASLVR
jgi:hypothetical protein